MADPATDMLAIHDLLTRFFRALDGKNWYGHSVFELANAGGSRLNCSMSAA